MSVNKQRYNQIGIDRYIRLDWLELTAHLAVAKNNVPTVKTILQEELKGAFRSANTRVRGSLDKTITILIRIWSNPPKKLLPLQRKGLELLSHLPQENHIVLHWGMTMAVYPFWATIAAYVGRLLKLQEIVTVSQIQRRMREQYGERETVSRATQRVLRSFVNWGVLKETAKKGCYAKGILLTIKDEVLISWLAEALLHTKPNGSLDLRELLSSTMLFPFRLSSVPANTLTVISQRLDVLRHGLDQELIMLRENNH